MAPPPGYPQKSRMAAGILAILLGTYGVHSFYLGNTSRGLLQLLLTLLTCGIGALIMFIWGVVDGVRILDGRINIDANGVYLKD
ncbi:MAG TPA: TM2 domain-containing protein [Candidatus Acutalibacter pullistercoris]|uniref:TM2 domain-containing protein n=1 Tax=Candidatus Acutalibacter pullistercoris TaxID=2838418 RepID=A0A9D1YEL7_9FIRM|nr:TM2 domain-containing protein [Candidatus Acutalibacter pullistercoris]